MNIRYKVLENKKVGTHSFYAQPDYTGTLDMNFILDRTCKNLGINAGVAKAVVSAMQDTIKWYLLRGYRCQIGEDFLTVYPNIRLSVKDHIDSDGNLVVADYSMLNANSVKASVECTVHPKFSKKFDYESKWEKE